jgi:hypothetical protein
MRKNSCSVCKLYTLFVALLPILYSYSSGIPGISIAEFILTLFVLYSFLDKSRFRTHRDNGRIKRVLMFFIVYTVFNAIFCAIIYQIYAIDILVRTTRLVFYIFCIIRLSMRYIDFKLFCKYSTIVAALCFGFIVMQYISFYSSGVIINGHLPFLKLYEESYEGMLARTVSIFRPSAFFAEPSILVWYMLPVLNYKINGEVEPQKKGNFIWIILISISMLLSKSLFGLVFVAVIWASYLFKKNKHPIVTMLFIFLIPIVGYFTFNSNIVADTLRRIDFSNLLGSLSFSSRFLQYDLFSTLNIMQQVFGIGLGNLLDHSLNNSIAYILTGNGIIGVVILATLFYKLLKWGKMYWLKILTLCLVIVALGSNALISCLSVRDGIAKEGFAYGRVGYTTN